ncbi:VCBS repeat-containing protein [Kamptonema cortianum]|nr:VCBS repeat-containing protein [Kamptonema cortianum]MDL5050284.1 VCBS repeat-containing protein [Oscillatoria amoena NRMC-F 0135]
MPTFWIHPSGGAAKRLILAFCLLCIGFSPLEAQQNLIRNGNFERTITRDNTWDGVDSSGNIKFIPRSKSIMVQGKQEQQRTFSPSIAYEDLDGDGLPDMVIADATGFFYFFKNLGPKEDPKFATGEIIPVFFINDGDTVNTPKITLSRFTGNLFDLIFGDYLGRIVRIPNTGSPSRPDFKMPNDVSNFDINSTRQNLQIPTRTDGSLWGNFFAPALVDWNGDGSKDLLIGEGTYSANAIHLFLNEGSDSSPRYSEKNQMVLAYGYGREQLVPQAVDWDGDGVLDLIIGSREGVDGAPGTLSFYKGRPIPKGAQRVPQLEFTDNIKIGGSVYNTPMAAPTVVDFNGNGLPDILIASPSDGRIKVALNKGTKTAPELAALVNVKAEDTLKRYKSASDWADTTDVNNVGNFNPVNQYAIVEVVDAESDPNANPPEGKNALKIHFPRPPLKFFQNNLLVKPDQRTITLSPTSPSMVLGKNYEISFKVKGNNMRGVLTMGSSIPIDEVPRQNNPDAFDIVSGPTESGEKPFTASSSWRDVSFPINLPVPQPARPTFKYKDGKTGREKFAYDGKAVPVSIQIRVTGQGELYLDDFKLIEK